jgi:4-hydroxythreonine-4-phosphate dehydrogenase
VPNVARFVDTGEAAESVRFGEISAEAGRVALRSIELAVGAIERGECAALVTAPIQKRSRARGGAPILAARAGLARYAHDYAMYFDSPTIRTVLLSVHVPLREAIATIDANNVAALARLTSREYARLYGKAPRIGAAGVNPHAGEGARFGSEEELIARGVRIASDGGIAIEGPLPADTLFLAARKGKYDVVMAAYHDQGLIPVKTLEFERSVNVTLGLPYLRCSVDHGTAFDIAGKNIADARPMKYAIEWAAQHAGKWSA